MSHPVHHVLPFWGFDITRRTEEVTVFLNKASQEEIPVVIAGDFNMTDQSGDYQLITRTYGDTYKTSRLWYGNYISTSSRAFAIPCTD